MIQQNNTPFAVKQLIRNGSLKNTPLFKQAWAMSAIFLSILSIGILQHPPTNKELHSEQNALSLLKAYNTATIFGYVASSILMDQVGRRLTFILGTLPGILSCFLMSYYPWTARVNTLRITCDGLSTGFTVILSTVVIGEYTSPKYRGVFLNLITTSMNIGTKIGLMLRSNHHWQLVMTALIFKTTSLGIALTWPESPYWLTSKERYKESEIAFQELRDTTCKKELAYLIALRQNRPKKATLFKITVNLFKKYSSSAFLRPLTVVIFGVIIMESSGTHVFPELSRKAVQAIGVDYQMMMISLSSIVTLSLVLIIRHRTQLLITGCLAASVMFMTSAYVLLISNNIISNNISWLGSLILNLQLVFSNLGSTSIPIALIGEVFPMEYKAVGSLVSGLVIYISSSAVLRSIPYLLTVVHLQGLTVIYGALMTISLLVLYVILPETKNKTLLEIEEYFHGECCEDEIGNAEVGLKLDYYTKACTIPLL